MSEEDPAQPVSPETQESPAQEAPENPTEQPAEEQQPQTEENENQNEENQEEVPELPTPDVNIVIPEVNPQQEQQQENIEEPPPETQKEQAQVIKLPPEPTETDNGIPIEDRAMWVSDTYEHYPTALEYREKTREWIGAHSLGRLKRVNFTTSTSQLDHYRILKLIFQHLHSIGLHSEADTLRKETKFEFQRKDQDWERTDLRLLVSMSLGPRDNLWDDTGFDNYIMYDEKFDHDNYSVRYEGPLTGGCEPEFYEQEMEFSDETHNSETIKTTTLHALVCSLLINMPEFVKPGTLEKMFSTLNSICKSSHFFAHLFYLYNAYPLYHIKAINLIDAWVSFSGLFIGAKTLNAISYFLRCQNSDKCKELLEKMKDLKYGHPKVPNEPPPEVQPEKLISNSANNESPLARLLNPYLGLAEPVPEETARQISLLTHQLFASINPREFYTAIANRSYGPHTPGLNELYEFGKQLKHRAMRTIIGEGDVEEAKTNMAIVIQIAGKLEELNNFEALTWFVDAFDTNIISNLSGIFSSLPTELQDMMATLKGKYDYRCKSDAYEQAVAKCLEESKPCVPSLRYEMSIIAASAYGGEEFINGKINFSKRMTIGKHVTRLVEFQSTPYNYMCISQIQNVIVRKISTTKEQLIELSTKIESPVKATPEAVKPLIRRVSEMFEQIPNDKSNETADQTDSQVGGSSEHVSEEVQDQSNDASGDANQPDINVPPGDVVQEE